MFTPSDPQPPERRRSDPTIVRDVALWLPVKMLAVAYLFTLLVLLIAPEYVNRDAALTVLLVFAAALNFSLLLPLSNIILHWNHSLFGPRFRSE